MEASSAIDATKKKKKNKRPGKRDREKRAKEATDGAEIGSEEIQAGVEAPSAKRTCLTEVIEASPSVHKAKEANLQWSFEVDYNDHFETPVEAFVDLLPCLKALAAKLQPPKDIKDLILYDPYWCQGRMSSHLEGLGVRRVINDNRDFYADIAAEEAAQVRTSASNTSLEHYGPAGTRPPGLPVYDILVTNPPYSGEHKSKLLAFLTSPIAADKPFALLLPAYTAGKAYWRTYLTTNRALPSRNINRPGQSHNPTEHAQHECYLLPATSYQYTHPEGTGKDAPPFFSAWFLGRFPSISSLRATQPSSAKYSLVGAVSDLVQRGHVVEKRLNPKQRKKRSQKQNVGPY